MEGRVGGGAGAEQLELARRGALLRAKISNELLGRAHLLLPRLLPRLRTDGRAQ